MHAHGMISGNFEVRPFCSDPGLLKQPERFVRHGVRGQFGGKESSFMSILSPIASFLTIPRQEKNEPGTSVNGLGRLFRDRAGDLSSREITASRFSTMKAAH